VSSYRKGAEDCRSINDRIWSGKGPAADSRLTDGIAAVTLTEVLKEHRTRISALVLNDTERCQFFGGDPWTDLRKLANICPNRTGGLSNDRKRDGRSSFIRFCGDRLNNVSHRSHRMHCRAMRRFRLMSPVTYGLIDLGTTLPLDGTVKPSFPELDQDIQGAEKLTGPAISASARRHRPLTHIPEIEPVINDFQEHNHRRREALLNLPALQSTLWTINGESGERFVIKCFWMKD
jgi:hypothetical protein